MSSSKGQPAITWSEVANVDLLNFSFLFEIRGSGDDEDVDDVVLVCGPVGRSKSF
jgi:hypothetical protein